MEGPSSDFVQKLVSRIEKGWQEPARPELPEISEVSFSGLLSKALPELGAGLLAPLSIPDPSEGMPVEQSLLAQLPGELRPALREQMEMSTEGPRPEAERGPLKLEALKGRSDDAAIDEVARQFESQFLYGMLKQIWESMPKNSLFGGDSAGQYYREMWLEELASRISSGSNGIGLAEVLRRDLKLRSQQEDQQEELARSPLPPDSAVRT